MSGLRYGIFFGYFTGRLPVMFDISRNMSCNSIQFAIGNLMDYWPDDLTERQEELHIFHRDTVYFDLFLHAPYLVNLATPNDYIRKDSIKSILMLRKAAYDLHAGAIVVHAGSYDNSTLLTGIKREADAIKSILKSEDNLSIKFLIENTAGGGTSIGGELRNIKSVIDQVNDRRVGMVLDTAHAYAAGIDLNNPQNRRLLRKNYEDYIELIHLNDTKVNLGSHIDQHADTHLGEGEITSTALASFVEEYDVPFIVEVAGEGKVEDIDKIKVWGKSKIVTYDRERE